MMPMCCLADVRGRRSNLTRCHAPLSSVRGDLERTLHDKALKALNKGRGKDGATPLMLACDIGDETIVR